MHHAWVIPVEKRMGCLLISILPPRDQIRITFLHCLVLALLQKENDVFPNGSAFVLCWSAIVPFFMVFYI